MHNIFDFPALIGAMAGDIVGSIYEFNNIKTTDFELLNPEMCFTDDSLMTLAVAQWINTDESLSEAQLVSIMHMIAHKYPCPMGGYGRGFFNWLKSSTPKPYNSWGNGAAMRVSAVGYAFDSLETTLEVAKRSAEVTHNHPEGIKGAQATASAIYLARQGTSKEEIRNYVESSFGYNLHRKCDEIRPTYRFDSSCQGTVPEALVAFFDSRDFEDALRLAVSLGGDSDTLACITGGVAAAYYKHIPAEIEAFVLNTLEPALFDIVDVFCQQHGYRLRQKPDYRIAERITPENITALSLNEVFVFGSNLAGRHGGGAARCALKFGAVMGQGVGPQGQCYAIPTMQGGVETIKPFVEDFIVYAQRNLAQRFLVTRVGCGIAGFSDEEIAPLFRRAIPLGNISLPEKWWKILL